MTLEHSVQVVRTLYNKRMLTKAVAASFCGLEVTLGYKKLISFNL